MKRRLLASLIGIVVLAFGTLATNLALGNTPLLGLDLQGGASVTLRPKFDTYDREAFPEVVNLYREKIEALGIGEYEVIRQGDTIIVNLPGVDDTEKAIDLIGTTGKVTFRPVLSRLGGFEGLTVPETRQGGATTVPTTVPATTAPGATTAAATSTTAPGGPSRNPSQDTGTTTPTTVAAPTTTAAPSTSAGETTTTVAGPTTTAAPVDPNSYVTPADEDLPDREVILPDRSGEVLYQMGPVFADGETAISTASAEIDPTTGRWMVALTLTEGTDGLGKWNSAAAQCSTFTETCADGGMAIILDHRVISAPVPQTSYFSSPDVSITGDFKESEARQLARVLRYGATPIEMKIETSQTVSATIGDDSLKAGIVAGVIGVSLVLALMLFYYRRLALVVLAGLMLSTAIIWSVVTMFDNFFVLTLAGVTGIIISIGVTVDSYVVFFERLKDEVKSGRSLRNSAQRGFAASWRTILAADFVSLLGAAVLWYLSVGSVRGFALFLGLSTVCDMVVAWFFTRPAVILLSRRPSFQDAAVLGIRQSAATPTGPAPADAPVATSGGVR